MADQSGDAPPEEQNQPTIVPNPLMDNIVLPNTENSTDVEATTQKEESVQKNEESQPKETKDPFMLFYDFDCTISAMHVYAQTQGCQESMFKEKYKEGDVKEWFGGEERIARVKKHFTTLSELGIKINIVSFGYVGVIRHALTLLGMAHFFETIVGRDSISLREVEYKKANLIRNRLIAENVPYDNCIFLDDDHNNVKLVRDNGVCRFVFVPDHGITNDIMDAVEDYMKGRINGKKEEEFREFEIISIVQTGRKDMAVA